MVVRIDAFVILTGGETPPLRVGWDIFCESVAVLIAIRLRFTVANYSFSTREKNVMSCLVRQTRQFARNLAAKLIKSFAELFQKRQNRRLTNFYTIPI